MDYKKLIKSRALRIKIMQLLSFVPDEWMVRLQYRMKTGRKLNLKNPQRYTEKLQWYKLNYRDPLMAQCADKYDVREYVKACGLEHILNECYGVYDSPDDIDFDQLPDSFVIKDTLGGGGNSVVICKDKCQLDWPALKQKMAGWVKPVKGKHPGREWVYDTKKNRIIIEKLIESDPAQGGLIDYKFLCFNGKVELLYVLADRDMGNNAGCGLFSPEYEKLNVCELDERPLEREIAQPKRYMEMIKTAEKLAVRFPEVRVDLYCQHDEIRFGELTFFDSSGYMLFDPDSFDFCLGDAFVLPRSI